MKTQCPPICRECGSHRTTWNGPSRRIVSIRDERLSDLCRLGAEGERLELAREGFAGKTYRDFVVGYCGGKVDEHRPVRRFKFERLGP